MKTVNLDSLCLSELNKKELNDLRGGFIPTVIVVALLISAIENFKDIREGFHDGWEGKPRYRS